MKPKKLVIKTVLNGWRVSVGCQEVVFTSKDEMMAEIANYLDNPAEVEKKYQEAVNYKHFEYAKQGSGAQYLWGSSTTFTIENTAGSPTPRAGDTATPSEAGESGVL